MPVAPEKRDDLESLAYTLLYLLRGSLPWLEEHPATSTSSIKAQIVPEELCRDLPPVYAQFLTYSRELTADVEPNYDFFIQAFGNVGLENMSDGIANT